MKRTWKAFPHAELATTVSSEHVFIYVYKLLVFLSSERIFLHTHTQAHTLSVLIEPDQSKAWAEQNRFTKFYFIYFCHIDL